MIKMMLSSVYFRGNTNAQIVQSSDGNMMSFGFVTGQSRGHNLTIA